MDNYFVTLNNINVNDKTEKKNGLTYLSWAWAWGEVKKLFPDATYIIYENEHGWNYHTDGRTCWVKTGVTVNGVEHVEYLPVMDFKNRSIPLEGVTSFDVNKAIQRSLTKALARHGLGLYIYAGEDLPEEEKAAASDNKQSPPLRFKRATEYKCETCGAIIEDYFDGRDTIPAAAMAKRSHERLGKVLCIKCGKLAKKEAQREAFNQATMSRHEDAGDRV